MTHVVTKSRMKGFLQAYEKSQIDFDCTKVFDNTGYAEIAEKQTLKMLKEEIEEENGYGFTKKSGIFLNFDEMEKQDEQ